MVIELRSTKSELSVDRITMMRGGLFPNKVFWKTHPCRCCLSLGWSASTHWSRSACSPCSLSFPAAQSHTSFPPRIKKQPFINTLFHPWVSDSVSDLRLHWYQISFTCFIGFLSTKRKSPLSRRHIIVPPPELNLELTHNEREEVVLIRNKSSDFIWVCSGQITSEKKNPPFHCTLQHCSLSPLHFPLRLFWDESRRKWSHIELTHYIFRVVVRVVVWIVVVRVVVVRFAVFLLMYGYLTAGSAQTSCKTLRVKDDLRRRSEEDKNCIWELLV